MSNRQLPETKTEKLAHLDTISSLFDNRFRIPGTEIRFGFDFLIGLVPLAGDLLTFAFSGILVAAMAKHGTSGILILKMLWNILIDMIVGTVPVLGDIFDLKFKANRRNFNLLKEHYVEEKHRGSAWPVILSIVLLMMMLTSLILFAFWKLLMWIFS